MPSPPSPGLAASVKSTATSGLGRQCPKGCSDGHGCPRDGHLWDCRADVEARGSHFSMPEYVYIYIHYMNRQIYKCDESNYNYIRIK